MNKIHFEWDEKKNAKNRRKHGIWFEEAKQVFDDPLAIRYIDLGHNEKEDRYLLMGQSASGRLILVIFCEPYDDVIRIISARKTTNRELKTYEEGI